MTAPTGWPWPRDTPLTRARKAAMAYRAALGLLNQAQRDQLDAMLTGFGETWVRELETVVEVDGLDAYTTAQAAELVRVPEYTIRRWACERHPDDPSRPLLPRFKRQGKSMTYLVRDIVAAAARKNGPQGMPFG